jgi:Domain of unknown function (DUF4112)
MSSVARSKTFIPEVMEPLPPDLVALTRFARLMDEAVAVPGTNRRVGLDAAIGLIPGVGDIVGALLSTWIVFGALRWRVPLWRIARMVANILIDMAFGAVPVVGDIFDFLFEENVMNLKLLLLHRDRTRPPRQLKEVAGTVIIIVLVVLGFALLTLFAMLAVVLWLIHQR